MSYPKAPGTSKEAYRNTEQNKKRDHLRNLLSNKFRGKYTSGPNSFNEEKIIQREVENFIRNNLMSEANLVKLDKQIASLLDKPFQSSVRSPS